MILSSPMSNQLWNYKSNSSFHEKSSKISGHPPDKKKAHIMSPDDKLPLDLLSHEKAPKSYFTKDGNKKLVLEKSSNIYNYIEPVTNLNGLAIDDGFSQYITTGDYSLNDDKFTRSYINESDTLPSYTPFDNQRSIYEHDNSDSLLLGYSEIFQNSNVNDLPSCSPEDAFNNYFNRKAKVSKINLFQHNATFQTASCIITETYSDNDSMILSSTLSAFSSLN
ncbi:hypothetical protein AYI70_g11610 [Smittium culicis]|uniref:Uncharacterized protein n=1 Tax=Smittium culicis TaxID=133412 RepID=A0A1R1WZ82_9FUNG|nr:hypothetical protein AYI70_g12051 [Smittium culicis]OMJ08146.1 hypothetical protein AYI70_g11739 [Smittium culicis]OMJ08330.1 hypothetical protein AYI70_g11610 [Smittium culicis]